MALYMQQKSTHLLSMNFLYWLKDWQVMSRAWGLWFQLKWSCVYFTLCWEHSSL